LKIKCLDSRVNVHILASTSVPFTLTTVQVPNLALTHTKRITVYVTQVEKTFTAAYKKLNSVADTEKFKFKSWKRGEFRACDKKNLLPLSLLFTKSY
jgi:hypothetical protein